MSKWRYDSERQNESVALNAKLKMCNDSKRTKWKTNNDSRYWMKKNDGSERRNKNVALNSEMKVWL